jgi:ABC-type transporter MlaC component
MNSENDLYKKVLEQLKEILNVLKAQNSIVKPKEDKNINIEIGMKKIGNISQKEYNSDYYKKNKDKYKIKHVCDDCKGLYTLATKSYHFKSKMHNKIIETLKKPLEENKN